jgi:hypothetical protein
MAFLPDSFFSGHSRQRGKSYNNRLWWTAVLDCRSPAIYIAQLMTSAFAWIFKRRRIFAARARLRA